MVGGAVATFADWLEANFTPAELADAALEATLWGPRADPDGAVANRLEAETGNDPRNRETTPLLEAFRDGTEVVLRFAVSRALNGVTWNTSLRVEAADLLDEGAFATVFDLASCDLDSGCTQNGITLSVVEAGGEVSVVELRIPDAPGRSFFRLAAAG